MLSPANATNNDRLDDEAFNPNPSRKVNRRLSAQTVGRPRIREDPTAPEKGGKGVYLENVVMEEVSDSTDVLRLLKIGTKARVVAKTDMNAVSSRSHAVLTLRVAQKDRDDDEGFTVLRSKVHLVDLAGSERQKATGATGARLKEGAGINKSLFCLGNVINALTAKGGRQHVPYRDSKLTRLLQDSLGGNSVTPVMILQSTFLD